MRQTAAHYDDPAVREISERLDIVDIVSESVALTRKGNRYWGLCPFHDEKTPSFTVTPERNMYYCFGCHAGGDIFSFIMKKDGLEFKEALQFLAVRAGVELSSHPRGPELDRRKKIIEVNRAAAEFYHQLVLGKKYLEVQAYIERRGIDEEISNRFLLGFALDQWNGLEEYLLRKGFSQEYVKASGLIKRNEERNSYYDLFRRRLMFPIQNYSGEIIGFGGRVLDDSLPKYLNTPETEIYSKRQNLYGLYQGREAIRQQSEVLLVEGYMDCIMMHQAGFVNCVAALGTSLTREQAGLIHRYAEKVVIIYDGDEAGQREALRASSILLEEGLRVSVLTLPVGKDPADLLELSGKEEFRRYIQNNKISHIEFKLKRCLDAEKAPDMEAKIRIIATVSPDINRLNSEVERDFYVKLLARRLGLEENLARRELSLVQAGRSVGLRNKTWINRDNIQYDNYSNYSIDEKIMAAMLADYDIFTLVKEAIGLKFFPLEEYRILASIYDSLTGESYKRLAEMARVIEGETLLASFARITALIDSDQHLKQMEVEAFIRRVERARVKARWQKMFELLEPLRNEADFNALLGFILKVDIFLDNAQEGGTA